MALYNFIESTGTIVPDTSDLLTAVQGEYTSAFGEDLNLDPETPQGILISMEVLARAAVAANNANLANQTNPDFLKLWQLLLAFQPRLFLRLQWHL